MYMSRDNTDGYFTISTISPMINPVPAIAA